MRIMSSLGSPTDRPPMARPSKPISSRPSSERRRSSSCMPPWTMPNSAAGLPSWAIFERLAQRCDSSIERLAVSKSAG
ncbi:hypothetical protein D3C78_1326950 [compost metagenome]